MRRSILAIVVVAVAVLFILAFFVPVVPLTTVTTQQSWSYNPPPCCPNSYFYYGSVGYFLSGVGMTYLPNPTSPPIGTGYQWSPGLPRWYCCDSSIVLVTYPLNIFSFNTTSATLNFTLENPSMESTTISLVEVNQMPCNNPNFATIKAGGPTPESCVVSGATFTVGELVNATMSFSNGQSTWAEVTAE
jgi:hypothetical protein